MFKKLLKYDMMAVWRFWWILAVSMLGLSFVGSLVLRFVIENIDNDAFAFFTAIGILFLVVAIIAIVASITVTQLFVYYRFYKNFFTDEGYLTFTLPVSRKQLLLSKTVNALIWTALHIVLLGVCAGLFMLFGAPADPEGFFLNPIAFQTLGEVLASVWQGLGAWLIVYVLEALILLVCVGVFSASLIHFCITMGSVVAKKAKLLAAIGIYYVVNMGMSFVFQLFGTFAISSFMEGFMALAERMSQGAALFAIAIALLVVCLIAAAVALIMYFMTLGKLERKLNLA